MEIDLHQITPKFYRVLKQFGPFGPGNMTPVFLTQNLKDTGWGKQVGTESNHLRVTLQQNNTNTFVGIGFGMGDKFELIQDKKLFKAVYSLDENEWNGTTTIQLRLRDLKE